MHFFSAILRVTREARGNATAEMALVVAPLVMFLFVIIATGQAMWLQTALNSAVSEAARCASVNPTLCGTASQVQTYAAGQAGAGFDTSVFAFEKTGCGNRVTGTYPLDVPMPFMTFSLNLSAQSCYPI